MKKTIILILTLVILSSITYAQVEGNANLLGWAYNVTEDNGIINITYDYSSLTTWITDETQLDLFYWNTSTSTWYSLGADLDTDSNILTIEQDTSEFPKVFVLGEKNETIKEECSSNMISYWKLDDNNGTTAIDTIEANKGTINGAV